MKCYFILKGFQVPSDPNPPVRGYTFSYTPSSRSRCLLKLPGGLHLFSGSAYMELTDLGELPKSGDLYYPFDNVKIQKIKAPKLPVVSFDDDEMEA